MPQYVPRAVIDAQEETTANGLSTLLSTITDEIKRLATDENIAAIQALAGSSGKLDTLMNMLGNLDANVTMVAHGQPATATVDGNGVIQIEIPSPLDGTDGEQGYTPAYDFFVEPNGDLYYKYTGTIQNENGAGKIENIHTVVHNYIDTYSEIFTLDNKIKLAGIEDGATADQAMSDIPMSAIIGTAPHVDNLEGVLYHMYSSGVMDGGDLIDNLDGTVDVETSQALLRATGTTSHDALIAVEVPAIAALALTNNTTNIIYADHNNGAPTYAVATDPTIIDMLSKVPLYYIVREGTTLHILNVRNQNVDFIGKSQQREFYTQKFVRKNGGAIIQDAGTLHLQCSAGSFYFQRNEYPLPELNTTGVDTFELYYRDGIGGWNESDVQTAPNTQYDDGSGVLATLANNKYGVHWVYGILGTNSHYAVVYGQSEYANVADAQASSEPTELPPSVSGVGVLLGRLVFQESAAEFTAVETVFSTSFVSPFAVNHENLDGLQGGTDGQHNHLTDAEYTTGSVSYDNTISGLTATNLKTAIDELQDQKLDKTDGGVVTGNVEFQGTVLMTGTATTVNSTTVTTSDNIIVLNSGEIGSGVTAGESGIEIDRGLLTNYQFKFDETDDSFKIGEVGSMQKVATREDTPTDGAIAYWDAVTFKFITTGLLMSDIGTVADFEGALV